MSRARQWLRPTSGRKCALGLGALVLSAAACGTTSASGTGGSGKNTVNSSWPTSLVLGEVVPESSSALDASSTPLIKLMKKQLDINLTVESGTSYASMIEAQQAGKAQLVGYGPFSYYIAKYIQKLPIENIGILLTAPDTDGGYYSEAVVNPKLNPTITSLKDAAGKKVCYSDPASTSGYLYPSYGLLWVGINPSKGVTPVFAGTDTATALQASKGTCQVGFTNNQNLPMGEASGAIDAADIKIIWTSPEIPGNPIGVSDSLPASLRTALQSLFINQDNSAYLTAHGYCSSVSACTTLTGEWGWGSPSFYDASKIAAVCTVTKSPTCTQP